VLPEQQSRSVVLSRRRRYGWRGLIKVLPRRLGNVWRGREIDNRFRALSRRYREKLGEPNEARDQTTASVAKACGDETGMQAIRSDTRTLQAASEFAREQDVAPQGAL
jgi:hypothetical protein